MMWRGALWHSLLLLFISGIHCFSPLRYHQRIWNDKRRAGIFGGFEDEEDELISDLKSEIRQDELAQIAAMAGLMDSDEATNISQDVERKRQETLKDELAKIRAASAAASKRAEQGYEVDPEKSITRIDVAPGDVWSP